MKTFVKVREYAEEDEARAQRVNDALSEVKVVMVANADLTNDRSLEAFIRSFCLSCRDASRDGVEQRIGRCTIEACGLWAVRPYQEPRPKEAS